MRKKVYTPTVIDTIKNRHGSVPVEQMANFFNVSPSSINSYIRAIKQYEVGGEIIANDISTRAFSEWAKIYGLNGEPKYVFVERGKGSKGKSETQMTLDDMTDVEDVKVTDVCDQEAVAMDDELKHDVETVKKIAEFISRDPDILKKAIDTIEKLTWILNEFLEDWRAFDHE